MCGIGLIVSGIGCVELDALQNPRLKDLVAVLSRRGPDRCGICTAYTGEVQKLSNNHSGEESRKLVEDWGFSKEGRRNIDCESISDKEKLADSSLQFVGTTLQLRGSHPVFQPLQDSDGNVLVYNGEVFGGLEVLPGENDTELVFSGLQKCSGSSLLHKDQLTIPQLMSQIRGPWALMYWQAAAQTLWFGRDAFGRRSLLVHWPSADDPRFLLSSVAPVEGLSYDPFSYWEELPCGIYSVQPGKETCLAWKEVTKTHDWQDTVLNKLVLWERAPNPATSAAGKALTSLKEAVRRRCVNSRVQKCSAEDELCPVAVLFSGGIDSMILAALVDQCIDQTYTIDLLNVSFDGPSAPDRMSAISGIAELQAISPTRCWKLVEVDEEPGAIGSKMLSLICPSQTHMDSNIGTALWFAAGGHGTVYNALTKERYAYKSEAKVVLVGAGADEQCGGYLRYRTKFKDGGWEALEAEMRFDVQRLWKRNLGRDDRCIADNGKEARFPFLDEDVIETFLDLPLHAVVDLREDVGIGDKKILRQVARLLGLSQSAALPKRAIQFGSGIAKKSNRREFGSNRAANKASAGSVKLRRGI